MKRSTRFLTLITLIAVLALAALPAFAQESITSREVTITEERINDSYRVTNPRRASITNMAVDLQPGQAVISATITFRNHDPIETVSVMVPTIVNNRLNWSAVSVTGNSQPVSDDLLAQINNIIASSWIRYVKNHANAGRIENITITDTEMVLTFAPLPSRSTYSGR